LQGTHLTKAQSKTVVNWYCCVGTGDNKEQLDPQMKVVADFNAAHPDIELKLTIVNNKQATDALSTLIASGQAPDIVGPVGFSGANAFTGQWLDLQPLVDKAKYDTKQFDPALLKIYQDPTQGLVGLPFATFPGLTFYNKDLFDEAGLKYPPAKAGDKYSLDGKDVDWDYDTVAIVAKRLTVDSAGNDATSDKFDPTKIVQYGFVHQFGSIRSEFSVFGGQPVVGADGKVKIGDAWRAEAQWEWNALWKDHFMPSQTASDSDLLKPNEFESGKVAMARVMSWYTCCVSELKAKWDLGIAPSYKGTIYAPLDADTFRIMKSTKNPDAAFTVLQYFLGDGALTLTKTYGAFPAKPDLQDAFLKAKAEQFPSVTHWDLIPASLKYAVSPHHESDYPGFKKGQDTFAAFRTALYGASGKDMDVNKALDKLQSDLQSIVDQAGSAAPAATAAK
jgi:multiple sugar transport system substrate-binding protein